MKGTMVAGKDEGDGDGDDAGDDGEGDLSRVNVRNWGSNESKNGKRMIRECFFCCFF